MKVKKVVIVDFKQVSKVMKIILILFNNHTKISSNHKLHLFKESGIQLQGK